MPTVKKTKLGKKTKLAKKTAVKKTTAKKTVKTQSKKHTGTAGKHIVVSNAKAAAELRQAMKNGRVIVLYHAEWCGHCKDFMPEWHKFIAVMKNKPDVDCMTAEVESANLGLIPEAGVQGFPTIRYYNSSSLARAPSENTEKATGLAALFGLADNARATATNSAGNNNNNNGGTDYTGSRTSNALLEYVIKNSQGKQSGGTAAKKGQKGNTNTKPSDEGVFKTLLKKGLDPKALTPAFKKEYRRLEKASRHAKKTLREVKTSLGFKA